jgi:hypothetical protein
MSDSLASGEGQPVGQAPSQEPQGEPKGDGASAQAWYESLSEDLKGSESLKKFKDVEGLAKSYLEVEHLAHSKVPNEKSKPEEWERFYNMLGRPEKPEGYAIQKPEALPPGVEWDDEMVGKFKEIAHKVGLTKHQAEALTKFHTDMLTEQAQSYWTPERGMAALQSKLKDESVVKEYVATLQRGVKSLGNEDFEDFLNTTGAGNDPRMLAFLHSVGSKLAEDASPPGQGAPGGTSVEEAKGEIARIKNDRAHPYHKGDLAALREMENLYKVAFGTKVVAEIGGR